MQASQQQQGDEDYQPGAEEEEDEDVMVISSDDDAEAYATALKADEGSSDEYDSDDAAEARPSKAKQPRKPSRGRGAAGNSAAGSTRAVKPAAKRGAGRGGGAKAGGRGRAAATVSSVLVPVLVPLQATRRGLRPHAVVHPAPRHHLLPACLAACCLPNVFPPISLASLPHSLSTTITLPPQSGRRRQHSELGEDVDLEDAFESDDDWVEGEGGGGAYRLGAGDEQFRDFSGLELKPDHFNRWGGEGSGKWCELCVWWCVAVRGCGTRCSLHAFTHHKLSRDPSAPVSSTLYLPQLLHTALALLLPLVRRLLHRHPSFPSAKQAPVGVPRLPRLPGNLFTSVQAGLRLPHRHC